MKRTLLLLNVLALTMAAGAQTLNVSLGQVTYRFPANQTGEMTYTNGTTLTIMGKAFTISDITDITIDNSDVTDNTVTVSYNGSMALVSVAGNVAQYVTPSVSGAHVALTQSDLVDDTVGEITYTLSGSSTDGEFYLVGDYKSTIELNGLTLTNTTPVMSGAAIHVQNGKRINVKVITGTTNTLVDAEEGSQKACLYSNGHIEFKQGGTLNVRGNVKHAIKSGEYMSVKNSNINVTYATGDGISCSEYFLMESGSLTISGVGDDGIQCDLDGTASTGETTGHEDEDSGNIYITGGTLNITAAATAAKCIKATGTVRIDGGSTTLNAQGELDLTDLTDPSYTSGIKAADFVQNDGTLEANVKGAAGRGVAATSTLTVNGGTLKVTNTGAIGASTSSSNAYFCTARGLKGTTIVINGGTVTVTTSGAASKGIKADDGSLTIAGGTVNVTTSGAGAYDYTESDAKGCACLKSDQNMLISGGNITLKSTGTGGKGIKADGTLNITDGTLSSTTTGGSYSYSSEHVYSRPKGVKANGALTIAGGTVTVSSTNHEGMESKSTITITGGTVTVYGSDDSINSAGVMKLQGGSVTAVSNGNDAIDSNGNMYISGGTIIACGALTPECGLDVIERGTLNITGGTILAIGGDNNAVSATTGSQCLVTGSQSGAIAAKTVISLKSGSTTLASFTVPSNYSPTSQGGGGPGGGMGGSSKKSSVLVSCAGMTSGTSYSLAIGSTTTSVKASTSTSSSRW